MEMVSRFLAKVIVDASLFRQDVIAKNHSSDPSATHGYAQRFALLQLGMPDPWTNGHPKRSLDFFHVPRLETTKRVAESTLEAQTPDEVRQICEQQPFSMLSITVRESEPGRRFQHVSTRSLLG